MNLCGPAPSSTAREPTVALLSWSAMLEDVLDPLGLSLDAFCEEFTGSWMFGYVRALRLMGVRTVLICMSGRVTEPVRRIHTPTGAPVCILPSPAPYRVIRRFMRNPYGYTVREAFGRIRGRRLVLYPLFAIARQVSLYLATPVKILARELRQQGCDAILCQEYEYPRFDVCVLLGRLLGTPVFATFQGGDYHHADLERLIRPLTMRACAGLVIATQSEIQRVVTRYRVDPGRIASIPNPIDVDVVGSLDRAAIRAELGIPPEADVAAWHGRVSMRMKGLDLLLEAWTQICRDRPGRSLHLLLVGSGPDADALQDRVTQLKLDNVSWVRRFVNDPAVVRSYLAASDAYVFPSRHEGFPVAPLEAMACGLPVVAAAAQGIPDILSEGEASGGIVVPRDDAPALARALGRVLDDPTLRRELGRRARARAEAAFSLAAVGGRLRALLCGGARDGRRRGEVEPRVVR